MYVLLHGFTGSATASMMGALPLSLDVALEEQLHVQLVCTAGFCPKPWHEHAQEDGDATPQPALCGTRRSATRFPWL